MFLRRRFLAGLLCTAFLATTLLMPVYAASVTELRKEQTQLNRAIKAKEKELKEKKQEQAKIFDRLREISSGIARLDKDLERIQLQKTVIEEGIEKTEAELEEAEARLEERTEVLRARLVEIYKQGEVNYLEVLLEATSFSDFLVRFHLLEKIAQQDMDLIAEIEAEREAIEKKKNKLEDDKRQLIALEKKAQENIRQLEQKQGEQKQIMASLETEKAAIEKGLRELEQASNAIAAKIRAAQSKSTSYSGKSSGHFLRPVSGRITSDYGWRTHPTLKTKRMHTGIDIGASSGTPIKAGDAGAVIFAGWLGAYGNAVVIDHGGGLSTLYGHMSSIGVREGQVVSRGQTIGKVGSTGWSTGPHLHFEVRVNGDPVSPWNYL